MMIYFRGIVVLILSCIACSKPADIVVNNGGDTVSPDYIPNPPSELNGQINGNKILLSWKDNSTGESGFVLSRKEHTRPFVQIAELESNVINFVDEPDSLSINYFLYRIQALGTADSSTKVVSNQINGLFPVQVYIDGNGIVNNRESNFTDIVTFDSTYQLNANAKAGWIFDRWIYNTEEILDNETSLKITGKLQIEAIFRQLYDLEVTIVGGGSVNEDLIKSKSQYKDGSLVQLTAIPEQGWEFKEWQGEISGINNPIDIEIQSSKNITAIFQPLQYNVNLNPSGEGQLSIELLSGNQNDNSFDNGSTIRLIAEPFAGWKFDNWSGAFFSEDNPLDYVIDSDLNLYGNFSLKSYLINVNTNGGQVNIQLIEGSKVQNGYSLGSRLKISAINDGDYLFTGWTGDTTSNETELELTLNSDISLTANFVELNPLDTENSFYDIEFVTDQVGFISASNVIYKTIDGGKSWDIIVSEEGYYFKNISFQDETIGYYTKVADPYTTEYLFVTKNGGLTWERLDLLSHIRSSTLNIKYEESVDIILESTNTIIWGINNRCQSVGYYSLTPAIDFSNNNGVSWDKYDGICLNSGSYRERYRMTTMDRINNTIIMGLLSTPDLGLYQTSSYLVDGETSFELRTFDIPFTPYAFDQINDNVIGVGSSGTFAFGDGILTDWNIGAIQEYTDHDFYDVYYQTENTIWIAGTDGLLIKTEDGGFNWDQIETNTTEDLKKFGIKPNGSFILVGKNGAFINSEYLD